MQRYLASARGIIGQEQRQVEMLEGGIRRAVEARREGRRTERKQDKKVRYAEEEQAEEPQARKTDEQDVRNDLEEVRTRRGNASLVRGRDERRRTDKTRGKGKGKGNGGKGEYGCKGGSGSRGARQREEDKRVQMAPNMTAMTHTPRP